MVLPLVEDRLVVEAFELRYPAAHEEKDHPFGLGREVGETGRSEFLLAQVVQGERTKTVPRGSEQGRVFF